MDYVLDCSVAMAWCFEDQATSHTEAALESLASGQALVPPVWTLEVANVLFVAERHGRMKPADEWQLSSETTGHSNRYTHPPARCQVWDALPCSLLHGPPTPSRE
jgi:hypothetical protein